MIIKIARGVKASGAESPRVLGHRGARILTVISVRDQFVMK